MSLVLSTLLTALLGGVTAVLVTIAIGVLATLPSTIVPASGAIVTSSSSLAAAQVALFTTPCGMLVNSVGFLFAWRALPPCIPHHVPFAARLSLVVVGSLAAWAALVSAMWGGLQWSAQHGVTTVLGPTCAAVALFAGAAACWHPKHAPKGGNRVGPRALFARGLLAGASVGASNVLAGFGESVLAGYDSTHRALAGGAELRADPHAPSFAAVFPAIFLSTMVSLWLAQGEAVPAGAVGPMMLGSVSVSAYSMLSGLLLFYLPLGWTIALSWVLASACVSVPSILFLRWRHASTARAEAPANPARPEAAHTSDAATV